MEEEKKSPQKEDQEKAEEPKKDKEEKEEKKEEEPKKEEKEEKKEEPKKEKEEDRLDWRKELSIDNNFSQEVPFDFKKISMKLKKASETPEKLNPYYTLSAIFDFTKFFKEISTGLSMGFSDITEKCGIMRDHFKEYTEATDIQNLLEIEMTLNLYKLNRDNNKEFGHVSGKYKDYISACRTFLRLLWFLEYLIDVFENVLKDDGSGPIKTILGNSYNKILAPHHTFIVKKAVGIALLFSSGGNVARNVDIIFGHKNYDEEARKDIQQTIDYMKIILKGGYDFYEKNGLLNLK